MFSRKGSADSGNGSDAFGNAARSGVGSPASGVVKPKPVVYIPSAMDDSLIRPRLIEVNPNSLYARMERIQRNFATIVVPFVFEPADAKLLQGTKKYYDQKYQILFNKKGYFCKLAGAARAREELVENGSVAYAQFLKFNLALVKEKYEGTISEEMYFDRSCNDSAEINAVLRGEDADKSSPIMDGLRLESMGRRLQRLIDHETQRQAKAEARARAIERRKMHKAEHLARSQEPGEEQKNEHVKAKKNVVRVNVEEPPYHGKEESRYDGAGIKYTSPAKEIKSNKEKLAEAMGISPADRISHVRRISDERGNGVSPNRNIVGHQNLLGRNNSSNNLTRY